MPIITLNEVKSLLKISDANSDTLILQLIPIAQSKIINYTRNLFINNFITVNSSNISFVSSSGVSKILNSEGTFIQSSFIKGDYIVLGSKFNDGIYEVASVNSDELLLSNDVLTNEASGEYITISKVKFPEDIKYPTAQLINYMLTMQGKLVNQESLPGGYSASFKEDSQIMSMFNLYRKPYV